MEDFLLCYCREKYRCTSFITEFHLAASVTGSWGCACWLSRLAGTREWSRAIVNVNSNTCAFHTNAWNVLKTTNTVVYVFFSYHLALLSIHHLSQIRLKFTVYPEVKPQFPTVCSHSKSIYDQFKGNKKGFWWDIQDKASSQLSFSLRHFKLHILSVLRYKGPEES